MRSALTADISYTSWLSTTSQCYVKYMIFPDSKIAEGFASGRINKDHSHSEVFSCCSTKCKSDKGVHVKHHHLQCFVAVVMTKHIENTLQLWYNNGVMYIGL